MFKNKKMLYQNKRYFLLALSILSDTAVTMGILVLPFIFIAVTLDPSVGEGIGWLWVFAMMFNVQIGIPAKIIDILCIKCLNSKNKLIRYTLLFLNIVSGIITALFWVFIILSCLFC